MFQTGTGNICTPIPAKSMHASTYIVFTLDVGQREAPQIRASALSNHAYNLSEFHCAYPSYTRSYCPRPTGGLV